MQEPQEAALIPAILPDLPHHTPGDSRRHSQCHRRGFCTAYAEPVHIGSGQQQYKACYHQQQDTQDIRCQPSDDRQWNAAKYGKQKAFPPLPAAVL